MRILTVGGGSGGHVTPVAAVIAELKGIEPHADIRFWCDKKFFSQADATMKEVDESVKVDVIASGKWRRYHKVAWWRQAMQLRTIIIPNCIDGFKIAWGLLQSLYKLKKWRPDVVFTKGGFVCLPVGIAAHMLKIPIVIHDSDAHPGLTNRILSRFASTIATGAPLHYYNYPAQISHYTGIPVASYLAPLSAGERQIAKQSLGFEAKQPLIVVTGGGLGAKNLNSAVLSVAQELLAFTSVCLVAGQGQVASLKKQTSDLPKNFQLHGYVVSETMQQMLGAADMVITRAGATTLLELAALAKPTIIVPNAFLTGGHQVKNATVYEEARAAVVIDEEELLAHPLSLVDTVNAYLLNPAKLKELSTAIEQFQKPAAARDVAKLIIGAAQA